MDTTSIILFLLLNSFWISYSQSIPNITVIGTVYCDICSNNTFTKNSYFLSGAKVQVECSFRESSANKEEMMVTVDRTTDKNGIYRVDIPPVDGFKCSEGRALESFCTARLLGSSSSICDVPGLSTSSEHMAVKITQSNLCIYNLNALNYRPSKKDTTLCGSIMEHISNLSSPLFLWPPFSFWHLKLPALPVSISSRRLPDFSLTDPRTWFPPSVFHPSLRQEP